MLTNHKESLEKVVLCGNTKQGVLQVACMYHTMHHGYPLRLFHLEEKMKSVVKCVCHVLCVTPSMHYYAIHVCGTWEKEERYRVLVGRVAVHSISVCLYCTCVCCHTMQVWVSIMNTVPFATGLYSCMIMSTACCNSLK